MKMKKLFTAVSAFMLMLQPVSLNTFAATEETAEVYVTIADEDGNIALAQEKITVTDVDGDDTLTINDALYAAHEAKYEGGAADGYGSVTGEYGLSMTKLWGVENGGSYGYCVNNVSAMSLADPIEDGDYINAYVYTDLIAWSDTYCYFDITTVAATQNEEITLTLSAAGYDSNYNPIVIPVPNAIITVDGIVTEYTTNTGGKVTMKLTEAGTCVISAISENQTLVPPVCVATVGSDATVSVYVTIAEAFGSLVMAQEEILVSDVDRDGIITINDTLYAAHEAEYKGGAATGYDSEYGTYGLALTKLWGVANGGGYGYYVNNDPAWSLADAVEAGDYVNAFVYTDLSTWSDTYCYFDVNKVTAEKNEEITLTLSAEGYDNNYNPIVIPVKDARITVNGAATEYCTNEEGKVTVKLETLGNCVISAISENQTLVPPVCIVTVSEAEAVPTVDPAVTPAPTATVAPTATPEPTETPEPTVTTAPTEVPEQEEADNEADSEPTSAGNESRFMGIGGYVIIGIVVVFVLGVVIVTVKKRNVHEK